MYSVCEVIIAWGGAGAVPGGQRGLVAPPPLDSNRIEMRNFKDLYFNVFCPHPLQIARSAPRGVHCPLQWGSGALQGRT